MKFIEKNWILFVIIGVVVLFWKQIIGFFSPNAVAAVNPAVSPAGNSGGLANNGGSITFQQPGIGIAIDNLPSSLDLGNFNPNLVLASDNPAKVPVVEPLGFVQAGVATAATPAVSEPVAVNSPQFGIGLQLQTHPPSLGSGGLPPGWPFALSGGSALGGVPVDNEGIVSGLGNDGVVDAPLLNKPTLVKGRGAKKGYQSPFGPASYVA